MEYLYAPWRGTYIKCNNKKNGDCCPFCSQIAMNDDEKNLILGHFELTTVFLNIFPYNPGHVLVVPNRHISKLGGLTEAENDELWRIVRAGVSIVEENLKNPGTNVGVNLGGATAGGSIPGHLHVHIVPRWAGDTAFLPVIANTKPLCEDLLEVFKILREPFSKLKIKNHHE